MNKRMPQTFDEMMNCSQVVQSVLIYLKLMPTKWCPVLHKLHRCLLKTYLYRIVEIINRYYHRLRSVLFLYYVFHNWHIPILQKKKKLIFFIYANISSSSDYGMLQINRHTNIPNTYSSTLLFFMGYEYYKKNRLLFCL